VGFVAVVAVVAIVAVVTNVATVMNLREAVDMSYSTGHISNQLTVVDVEKIAKPCGKVLVR
jgi:hypothetical protein